MVAAVSKFLILTSLSNQQTTPGSCSMKNCVLLGEPIEEEHATYTLPPLRDYVAIRSEPFESSGRTDKYLDYDTVSARGGSFFCALSNAGEFFARGKYARS